MKINLPRIEDISFKKKLILIQLIIYVPILIICCLTFLIIDIKQYKKDKKNSLISIANIIGANSNTAILNQDSASASRTLSALKSESDITNGCIVDNLGKILAVYNKTGSDPFKFSVLNAKENKFEYEDGQLLVYDKILLANQSVGLVCIRAKLSQLNTDIIKKIEIALLILFLSILLTVIITPRLQKYFSLPLFKLVKLMREISKTNNYNLRSSFKGEDEIGELSIGLNEMLEKIQSREQAIQNNIHKLNSILESIGDGIIVSDKEGNIIHTNSASATITGVIHQEEIEMKDWQNEFGIFYPDKKTPYKEEDIPLSKAIKGEELNNEEVFLENPRTRKGIYINVTARPVLDKSSNVIGGVVIFRDITEKKTEEEKNKNRIDRMFRYQESILKLTSMELEIPLKLKLRKIQEVSAKNINVERVSIWLYNDDRTAVTTDDIYIKSEDTHKPGMTIKAKDYPRYFLAMEVSTIDANDALHDTRTHEFSEGYLKPNGITSLLDVPIRIGGRLFGIVCYEHVGTQRKWTHEEQIYASSIAGIVAMVVENHQRVKSEQELQKLNTELSKAKNYAELSNKSKNRFLANISHKIRNTPLNAIVGFLQLLKETKINTDQEDIVDSIELASKYLLVIINDILDLSEIESGKLTFATNEININEIIEEAVNLVKAYAHEKNLNITIHQDESIPEVLRGDSERLNQVITNLITNSIKFTEKGKITIDTKLQKETSDEVICEFRVKDTGIGMEENKINQFTEPLSKDLAGSILKHGETGFGLAVSRILVEMQGGSIDIKSEPGVGTEISFSLPFKKVKKVSPKVLTENGHNGHDKKLNILLAEDMELNQTLVSRIIGKTEHTLDIAIDGKEAVEKVKNNDYDLILMDIQMPELDGCQATSIIRNLSDENKSKIPIIALTAYVSEEEGKKYIKLGMNAHIKKPFNKQDLLNIIDKLTPTKDKKTLEPKKEKKPAEKVFDLSYLEETADGDNEFLADMIQLFIENTEARFKDLDGAIKEKNYKDITLIVHKIKNLVLPFQMNKAIELTQSIEEDSRAEENLDQIITKIDKLKSMVFEAVKSLENELDRLKKS